MAVRIEGTDAYIAAAQALNDAGDKGLRNRTYAAFRDAARPLGQSMLANAGAELPKRGGLAARVAASKLGQSNATTGRSPAVALTFKSREGYALAAMDAGILRHPVFARQGRPRVWRQQAITPGVFSRPFDAGADEVRTKIVAALEQVAVDIRNGAGSGSKQRIGT